MKYMMFVLLALSACAPDEKPREDAADRSKALCEHFASEETDEDGASFLTSDTEAYCP